MRKIFVFVCHDCGMTAVVLEASVHAAREIFRVPKREGFGRRRLLR
jgi:hypothetical protein